MWTMVRVWGPCGVGSCADIMVCDIGRSGKNKTPSKKLAKLLGEDVTAIPFNPTVPPPNQPETPWYLSDDFESGEIIFDDKGGVKAGTLKALVIRLTQHSSTGE